MIRSMTGFGRGEASDARRKVTVEVRCVNHRYSDYNLRLPRDLYHLEEPLRRLVKDRIRRGRVDLFLVLEDSPDSSRNILVDVPLARSFFEALEQLRLELGLAEGVRLEQVLRLPDVVRVGQAEPDQDVVAALAKGATTQAVAAAVVMRLQEGEAIRHDLHQRLQRLGSIRSSVTGRAGLLVPMWRDRLLSRLEELLSGAQVGPDHGRLEQEVAIYAERSDISEELVRWESHIRQMAQALDATGDEPVGRRLDFLCQEILREVNTVGSKALDSEIAGNIVTAKEELERVREQLQNIE